ncbi:hypothetical protein COJ48_04135 [Bacillus cereus]|uniref:hypothetical protein n=1 Tax=Bacillus paramycoides TaxID=2026194 RepID=UPI000BFABF1B|nr:hypothetical protein [Bacillus paramycoides]PFD45813.1 hypothetical protein CN285_02310 [Bacillus cereus]PFM65854.1 hypothetical protein COJ48_04135 [Bacillus cereus]PGM62220.1 hypothetical protein CN947_12070 [Bacillus cereus]PGP84957.1 hypothetical protein CN997_10315 [Bacillus cereus]
MVQLGLAYPDPNEAKVDRYFSFIHHLYAYVNPASGDFAKHLFLFTVCLDVMLVSWIWWLAKGRLTMKK